MAKTKLDTFYMPPYGAPTKHVVKMASLVVPCSNLKRTKHQRSGQVYHILLLRKAYYSSQVSRDMGAIIGRHVRAIRLRVSSSRPRLSLVPSPRKRGPVHTVRACARIYGKRPVNVFVNELSHMAISSTVTVYEYKN